MLKYHPTAHVLIIVLTSCFSNSILISLSKISSFMRIVCVIFPCCLSSSRNISYLQCILLASYSLVFYFESRFQYLRVKSAISWSWDLIWTITQKLPTGTCRNCTSKQLDWCVNIGSTFLSKKMLKINVQFRTLILILKTCGIVC